MGRCSQCGEGINSSYIREGEKGLLKKTGYYCPACDIYYSLNLGLFIAKIEVL
jgi:hypothetical protein